MKQESRDLLAMAARRVRPGTGSADALLRERTGAYGRPGLECLRGRLPFVVVGGLATRLYMPERMTLDADVLVLPGDVPAAEGVLREAGGTREGPLAIGGSTWRMPDGQPIDLVSLTDPWVEEAVLNPVHGPDGLPYIRLPYLVLMKLAASRVQDLADISRMLGVADAEAVESVRSAVRRHCPGDLDDLEGMLRLGRLEHGQ